MVQYLQNNVIMKWTTRFIRFTGWIPLKYGLTTTPPIIAHCQTTPMSSLVFHIAIPKTSNTNVKFLLVIKSQVITEIRIKITLKCF